VGPGNQFGPRGGFPPGDRPPMFPGPGGPATPGPPDPTSRPWMDVSNPFLNPSSTNNPFDGNPFLQGGGGMSMSDNPFDIGGPPPVPTGGDNPAPFFGGRGGNNSGFWARDGGNVNNVPPEMGSWRGGPRGGRGGWRGRGGRGGQGDRGWESDERENVSDRGGFGGGPGRGRGGYNNNHDSGGGYRGGRDRREQRSRERDRSRERSSRDKDRDRDRRSRRNSGGRDEHRRSRNRNDSDSWEEKSNKPAVVIDVGKNEGDDEWEPSPYKDGKLIQANKEEMPLEICVENSKEREKEDRNEKETIGTDRDPTKENVHAEIENETYTGSDSKDLQQVENAREMKVDDISMENVNNMSCSEGSENQYKSESYNNEGENVRRDEFVAPENQCYTTEQENKSYEDSNVNIIHENKSEYDSEAQHVAYDDNNRNENKQTSFSEQEHISSSYVDNSGSARRLYHESCDQEKIENEPYGDDQIPRESYSYDKINWQSEAETVPHSILPARDDMIAMDSRSNHHFSSERKETYEENDTYPEESVPTRNDEPDNNSCEENFQSSHADYKNDTDTSNDHHRPGFNSLGVPTAAAKKEFIDTSQFAPENISLGGNEKETELDEELQGNMEENNEEENDPIDCS